MENKYKDITPPSPSSVNGESWDIDIDNIGIDKVFVLNACLTHDYIVAECVGPNAEANAQLIADAPMLAGQRDKLFAMVKRFHCELDVEMSFEMAMAIKDLIAKVEPTL